MDCNDNQALVDDIGGEYVSTIKQLNNKYEKRKMLTVTLLTLSENPVLCQVDTGATCNVMSANLQ